MLFGIPELRPRWKRAVAVCDAALGDAVGKLYVEKYFSPAEKKRAEAMVRNLLAAFDARIDKLDWMAPQTKAVAKDKLKALKIGVGYPDHWRSYAGHESRARRCLRQLVARRVFEYKRNLAKLGQNVDRSEWVMNAQLVNAVNLPAMNAINFPAAVLQPPYFDPKQPLSMDYGAIGATIGHEISHSFDDQGALFDAQGRLKNWWQPNDFAHFRASGARLAAQFDAYKPFPDLSLNGAQTLSENIADVAGLNAAYDAYRLATERRTAREALRLRQRPVVLLELRPELARENPRRRAARPSHHRRPRPRPVPHLHRAQSRRLVRRLPGQARADFISRRTNACASGNPTPCSHSR